MIKYPFISCLHPVRVLNKGTGEKMVVGCGKCAACRNLRASSLTLKCKLESKAHKYCHFITLTYDDTFVPLSVPVAVHGTRGTVYQFISTCARTGEYGDVLTQFSFSECKISTLYEKLDTQHGIPYLSRRDAQLFVKRLRKNLSTENYANIRFFLCGEYGLQHLRPHYHLLVWHSDQRTSEGMADIVSKSWKLGRTHCELVKNDSASYVASYVNNLSSLPDLYKQGKYKPFSCHSFFLGEKFYRSQGKETFKVTANEFVRRSEQINGSVSEFTLWRSLKNTFYPKCRGFATSSSSQRQFLYSLYARFRKRKATSRQPYRLAQEILQEMIDQCYNYNYVFDDLKEVGLYYDGLTRFSHTHADFISDKHLFEIGLMPDSDFLIKCELYIQERQRVISLIYRDLAMSKKFLELNCNSYNPIDIAVSIRQVELFYSALELSNLGDMFRLQDEMLSDGSINYDDLEFFYDNMSISNLLDSAIYKIYKQTLLKSVDDRQKHKKQNDANRIHFCHVGLIE